MTIIINDETSETLHSQSDTLIEANRAAIIAKAKKAKVAPEPETLKTVAFASVARAAEINLADIAYPVHVGRIAVYIADRIGREIGFKSVKSGATNKAIRGAAAKISEGEMFSRVLWPELAETFRDAFNRRGLLALEAGEAKLDQLKGDRQDKMLKALRRDVCMQIVCGQIELEPDAADKAKSLSGKDAVRDLLLCFTTFDLDYSGELSEAALRVFIDLRDCVNKVADKYKVTLEADDTDDE